MAEILELIRLQEIDVELDALRQRLGDVERRLGESDAVAIAREEMATAERQLAAKRGEARDLEYQAQDLTKRISDDEARLYGGRVGARDLEAMQREVEHLRQQLSQVEDRLLVVLDEVEQLERRVADATTRRAAVEEQWGAEQSDALALSEELLRQVRACEERRSAAAGRVSPAALAIYEELNRRYRGTAIVAIERNMCRGCRIAVPSSVVTQVRLGRDLVRCPSCGRLLFGSR
jgi:predicted  nucleic acid-binding Zn-ribbon protein